MADDLKGMRVAILATDGVERIELEQPRGALYGAGAASDLLSIHTGEIQARQFDLVSKAGTFPVDRQVTDASAGDEYDAAAASAGQSTPTCCASTGTLSTSSGCSPGPESPSRRSATARGPCSRRMSCAATG